MSKILHILLGCLFMTALNAQTPACTPDIKYKDSTAGPYPRPFDAVNNPKGGIDKPACLGKPYSFTFTIKITDSITVKLFGNTVTLPLDSVVIAKTGGITGMPVGINYACNPPSCAFPKNTLNCVIISGTTATSNAIKDYSLQITGKAYNFLAPGGQEIKFPGPDFPGEYLVKVLAASDPKCISAVQNLNAEISAMTSSPNPFGLNTQITIESNISGLFQFDVMDLMGKNVFHTPLSIQAGTNSLEFNADNLPNGIYIYSLSKGNKVMSNKFIVNK